MGWSVGFDENWDRDIGYGVPAICDKPGCDTKIHRGLAFICGSAPYGGEAGCALYFCFEHLVHTNKHGEQLCNRCANHKPPYKNPKPDTKEWIDHKLTDESWAQWRKDYPAEAAKLKLLNR